MRTILKNDFLDFLEKNAEKTYLRFGLVPESGRSFNFRDNFLEKGVSVYAAYKFEGKYIVNPRNIFTFTSYFGSKKAYEISGNELSTLGSDDEPLLENAKIVKSIKNDSIIDILGFAYKKI